MNIEKAIEKYLELGDFFSPDYERENEVLTKFKEDSTELSQSQIIELIEILNNKSDLNPKFFVADLLYLYNRIDEKLLDPLINSAIALQDPSFNRIFIKPCIRNFGVKKVAEKLTEKFKNADLKGRVSISNLVYWLRPQKNGEADLLHSEIINRANATDNLIELYFYNLNYRGKIKNTKRIPSDANGLMKAISGNSELEHILFDELKWKRKNVS
jgi:hypothetical protein